MQGDPSCPPEDNQYCTVTQGGWGGKPNGDNPAQLLATNFGAVYPGGIQFVGTSPQYYMEFTSAEKVGSYLPAGGSADTLSENLSDPTSTSAGVFGGQVLALRIAVDLSNSSVLPAGLGSVIVTDSGTSIASVLADAQVALGGGALPSYVIDLAGLNALVDNINNALDRKSDGCKLSDWALTHLLNPPATP